MIRYAKLAALSIVLASTGCVQSTEPLRSLPAGRRADIERPFGAAAHKQDHLSTSVELPERFVPTGGPAKVVLCLTNRERHPITASKDCLLFFEVFDRRGVEIPIGWTCGYSSNYFTLGAGETYRVEMNVFDFTGPLPPGPYRIHAYLTPYHHLASPPAVLIVTGPRETSGADTEGSRSRQ